jgi:Fur family iron response transcriptional regulator
LGCAQGLRPNFPENGPGYAPLRPKAEKNSREKDLAPRAKNYTEKLRNAGLRPTRQRLALAQLLFSKGDRHVSAEALHEEAVAAGVPISLATVYNSMHQFTAAGLLREVTVNGSRIYFDTNIGDHHHFYCEDDGMLLDIDGDAIEVAGLPSPPHGARVDRVDVIVRLKRR